LGKETLVSEPTSSQGCEVVGFDLRREGEPVGTFGPSVARHESIQSTLEEAEADLFRGRFFQQILIGRIGVSNNADFFLFKLRK
jgi:hypothetical protein